MALRWILSLTPGCAGTYEYRPGVGTHLGWAAYRLGFRALTPVFDGADEAEIEAELARAWMVTQAWTEIGERAWEWIKEQEYFTRVDPR